MSTRAAGRLRRSVALITVGVIIALVAVTASQAIASAAPARSAPSTSTPAPKAEPTSTTETYAERLDRIGTSGSPLLRPLDENRGQATTCVGGDSVTLSVVFDSIFESTLPSIPAALRPAAQRQRAVADRDLARLNISTLAISENPFAMGADSGDPVVKYRTPLSQWIVVQLLKIRDGKQNEAIPVGNITLLQAVETAWLYFFVGVLAPLQFGAASAPSLGSPLSDTVFDSAAGLVTYNGLLQAFLFFSRAGLTQLYERTASSLVNLCVARVNGEQLAAAGRAARDVTYRIPIPALVQQVADQVALADSKTCTPISSLPLERIVSRTTDYAQSVVTDAPVKASIRAQGQQILATMRSTPIPLNLIPADPADFTQNEALASILGGQLAYLGGAPMNIAIGLAHNITEGDDLRATVPLSELTVNKSLTAMYYAYHLSINLFSSIGGLVQSPALSAFGVSSLPISPVGIISAALGLGRTYGLQTYQHVIRDLCLREDDTTGTGLGAEAKNRHRSAAR